MAEHMTCYGFELTLQVSVRLSLAEGFRVYKQATEYNHVKN